MVHIYYYFPFTTSRGGCFSIMVFCQEALILQTTSGGFSLDVNVNHYQQQILSLY